MRNALATLLLAATALGCGHLPPRYRKIEIDMGNVDRAYVRCDRNEKLARAYCAGYGYPFVAEVNVDEGGLASVVCVKDRSGPGRLEVICRGEPAKVTK